jgi:hypothetical protein
MTATLDGVTTKKQPAEVSAEAARELVRRARERGLALTGPDGLLKQLTKTVIETALNEEMTGHLGYKRHGPAGQGAGSGNVRNGTRPETVLTGSIGPVGIEVPRDRAGTSRPQIVKKRQRRLTGVDEIVLSLYAKGLTTGEISAHFAEIYGASVSKETVSRITDKVIEEMQSWQNRPLDERPRPLVSGPATSALVVAMHAVPRASQPGQQVVPQARPTVAQHRRPARSRGLCPQFQTTLNALHVSTDQKAGGSSPSERAQLTGPSPVAEGSLLLPDGSSSDPLSASWI